MWGVLATGYNVVDIEAAKEKGIPVTNIPTYGTTAVAQMVFALLLEICHHVGEHSEAVHRAEWTNSPDFCFWNTPLMELAGKTIGVIGFGRIGQNTAQIARAFGLQVLAYDEYPNDAAVLWATMSHSMNCWRNRILFPCTARCFRLPRVSSTKTASRK